MHNTKWLIDKKITELIDHEFGHAWYNACDSTFMEAGLKKMDWIKTEWALHKGQLKDIVEELSRYADADGIQEFWAEWFAGHKADKLSSGLKSKMKEILEYKP